MSRILVVDDESAVRASLAELLAERLGHEVVEARDGVEAFEALQRESFDLVLADLLMPRLGGIELIQRALQRTPELPIVVISGTGRFRDVVDALRAGAYDFLQKPIADLDELEALVARALERGRLRRENASLRDEVEQRVAGPFLAPRSPAAREALQLAERVARTTTTVLLLGESGTGKEVLARRIHALSERARGPFVGVNCAALPPDLAEAELFGHERGAFTGADRARAGRFESAHGGTLFLDEIGEMPLALQAKLLRVLQEREIQPLGSDRTKRIDVRVIAATHRDLEAEVRAGRFREDLYYRIRVFVVRLPPLRERSEDLPELAEHFVARCAAQMGRARPSLAPDALAALQAHTWPGNVRELENAIERALILCEGERIDARHLGALALPGRARSGASSSAIFELPPGGMPLAELERVAIESALRQAGGNVAEAARLLDLDRGTLRHRLRKYGLGR
ncbi:MAG: sigma-54-dependent Fis family transcriptional regulator [Planctomycetes bacterium]|nr:sigma-54-dependent Fis family transcriptional regulator [Planctomycetota bacterium]